MPLKMEMSECGRCGEQVIGLVRRGPDMRVCLGCDREIERQTQPGVSADVQQPEA